MIHFFSPFVKPIFHPARKNFIGGQVPIAEFDLAVVVDDAGAGIGIEFLVGKRTG